MIYVLFIIGFVLLIVGADKLVDGASSIALKYQISPIVIGLTIVAFGTSAPELIVNLVASYKGNTEIAIGNVLGSNIVNILLILGISAIIYPIVSKKNTVWKEIPLSLLAALLVGLLANDIYIDYNSFNAITRIDGLVLLSFFIIFLYYTFGISNESSYTDELKLHQHSVSRSIVYILGGLTGLVLGGKWIVDGAVHIATRLNISQSIIGLTIVAIGTSLPELATSAMAAYKKQTDIAIGNVVGSNIFNIFFILGISAVIRPLPFNANSNFDIWVTIGASILLFLILFLSKIHTVKRWHGVLMILCYIVYITVLISKEV